MMWDDEVNSTDQSPNRSLSLTCTFTLSGGRSREWKKEIISVLRAYLGQFSRMAVTDLGPGDQSANDRWRKRWGWRRFWRKRMMLGCWMANCCLRFGTPDCRTPDCICILQHIEFWYCLYVTGNFGPGSCQQWTVIYGLLCAVSQVSITI